VYCFVNFLPERLKRGARRIPILCATKLTVVASTPSPYWTLRLKLIDDASSKYFVGQDICKRPEFPS